MRPRLVLHVVLAVFATATATLAQDGVAGDKAALAALYNATDGANWTTNTNWNSEQPLGGWHGVTTNGDGRVTALALNDNGLDGTLPAALGDLTALEQLDLGANDLSGALSEEIADLTSLTSLLLNESRALTGALSDGLRELSDLNTVRIQDTELCAPEDDAFRAWLATITFSGLNCPRAEQSVIDVAIFYTPDEGARLESRFGPDGIGTTIDVLIAEANTFYATSGVNQRLNVVALEELAGYTRATSDQHVFRIRSPSDVASGSPACSFSPSSRPASARAFHLSRR